MWASWLTKQVEKVQLGLGEENDDMQSTGYGVC